MEGTKISGEIFKNYTQIWSYFRMKERKFAEVGITMITLKKNE
jgi:hypothetical protein